MSAGRLIIWRHGRTAWNLQDKIQGQADIPLDEVGIAQARAAASRLAALAPTRLFSSDLQRAAATAGELAVLTGLTIEYDKALREIDVDDWAGLTQAELAAQHPEAAARVKSGQPQRRGTAGETTEEVATRFAAALTHISTQGAPEDTIVIATHGMAARVGICTFLGIPAPHWPSFGGLSNCNWVSLLPNRTPGWRIEEWNAGSLPEPVMSDDPQP
ncbi:histidine phosphatase family protein [Kribbella sandramycini]|uniref:Histidine phosphatase family protein n=1 Tax=Kribbella sandramycini TaxID=60450 RepID=A0A7Y4KVP7_9ACTN|nr:histidine phosphatase family protein [Kribbella sandramycini]MBB6567977.1 putative phosphoglycerate mutase [Kribbella sandramycini]NOL39429.1 histidine phosphatase family protein [Kribbella sandramycini]